MDHILITTNKNLLIDVVTLTIATALACAFAILAKNAVVVDGNYLPYGVDAFYHARRILDTALYTGVVQQFDPNMHVPEGSWVPWPWGFDRFVAALVQLTTWMSPGIDPMRVVIYVPVAWIPVNIGLLIGVFNAIGLRPEFRAIGVAGFALSPLTQRLHGIGAIDHHFMESTFVLLVTLFCLRWIAKPSSLVLASTLGACLGTAHAFHHGLFILQLPVLGTLFVLWLRQLLPTAMTVRLMCAALLTTIALVALPSEPLWDGQFSMATFSWFHIYIAFCTTTFLMIMSFKTYSPRWLIALVAVGAALSIPVAAEVVLGARFLTGQLLMLDQIIEMASPLHMIRTTWGLMATLGVYSGLLLLAPILLLAGIYIFATEKRRVPIGYGIFSVFGLGLLLMQYRLNYFGLCFLLAGPLYFVGRIFPAAGQKRALVFLGVLVAFAVLYRPPLGGPLFRQHSAAGDHLYEDTQELYPVLRAACAKENGVVAASPQFGHYIRFHTNCSVIANNFLLTKQHFDKVDLANSLFHLSVSQIRAEYPEIRYVFAFLANTYEQRDGKLYLRNIADVRSMNPLLINELMLSGDQRNGAIVLGEAYLDLANDRRLPIAGVYKIPD